MAIKTINEAIQSFEISTKTKVTYVDATCRSRETSSSLKLSDGRTFYGEHFGGGYTKFQAISELLEQVQEELEKDSNE